MRTGDAGAQHGLTKNESAQLPILSEGASVLFEAGYVPAISELVYSAT